MNPTPETSLTAALDVAVDEMKSLLHAIATRVRDLADDRTTADFARLRKELFRYQAIVPPPPLIQNSGDAWAFWGIVSQGRSTYAERRTYISENFSRYYDQKLAAGDAGNLETFLRARDITLGSMVGGGGFGDVYRGDHGLLGARAIKVFRPHFYDGNREALLRFTREAKLLSQISHERVVRFYDAGIAPGAQPQPFLVTEFVEGKNLEDQLREKSMFTADEALLICEQVLDGLQAAHAVGVVHRDIKPNNLMWVDSGVRIIDLGSGGIMADILTTRITQQAQGTLGYIAPELLEDPQLLDRRTDFFSVGVLLHRLITGRALQPSDPGHYLGGLRVPSGLLDFLLKSIAPIERRFEDAYSMKCALLALRPRSVQVSQALPATQAVLSGDSFLVSEGDIKSTLGLDPFIDVAQEWLAWARLELVGPVKADLFAAWRILRIVAVMVEVPALRGRVVTGIVGEDELHQTARVVFGLIDDVTPDDISSTISDALSHAVKVGWLREEEYDTWHPGMASGTGMRMRYQLTPLGRKALREVTFTAPPQIPIS